jgi:hypothetical protein
MKDSQLTASVTVHRLGGAVGLVLTRAGINASSRWSLMAPGVARRVASVSSAGSRPGWR